MRWGLREAIGHEGKAPVNGIFYLYKRPQELSPSIHQVWTQREESGFSTDSGSVGALSLDFQPPEP